MNLSLKANLGGIIGVMGTTRDGDSTGALAAMRKIGGTLSSVVTVITQTSRSLADEMDREFRRSA